MANHYINQWEKDALSTPGMKQGEQRKLCISLQTIEGLRITGWFKFSYNLYAVSVFFHFQFFKSNADLHDVYQYFIKSYE